MDDNPFAVKQRVGDGRLQLLPCLEKPVVGRGAIRDRQSVPSETMGCCTLWQGDDLKILELPRLN